MCHKPFLWKTLRHRCLTGSLMCLWLWHLKPYEPIKPLRHYPASIYLFKVNNENTKTICEICYVSTVTTSRQDNVKESSGIYLLKVTMCKICCKLTIKIPEWRQWRHFGVFIVNLEQISHIFVEFPLLTLNK